MLIFIGVSGVFSACQLLGGEERNTFGTVSISAFTGKNSPGSLPNDFDIKPGRPGSRVAKIQAHHLVECSLAAAIDLPESGDSWFDLEHTATVPGLIRLQLIGNRRARPNQRHVTLQHVDELGELVQTGLADEPADTCDTRILLDFVDDIFLSAGDGRLHCSFDEALDVFAVNAWIVTTLHGPELQKI